MSVRSRTIALVAATSLMLWIGLAVVGAMYATRSANDNDWRDAMAALDSAAAAVNSEEDKLVAICGDWGPWDDAYNFVKHPSRSFVNTNLPDQELTNLGVDFMVFTDSSGRIVFAKAVDPTTRDNANLPSEIIRYLATQPSLLHEKDPKRTFSGALATQEGPYLLAAQPIGKSDLSSPPDGTFLTGYLVGPRTMNRIRNLVQRPVRLYSIASRSLPADVQSELPALAKGGSRVIRANDDSTMLAYQSVVGIQGRPGLVMRITTPRAALAESRTTLIGLGGVATALQLVLLITLAFALDRTVLRRLTKLNAAVRDVGLSTDIHTRVPVMGADEIGGLAAEINRMLDERGRSQEEMEFLVEHDALTGLFNRRHFENELKREIAEHQRLGDRGAILWFDLDHFKDINDSLGHAAGDELLREFGKYLRRETRAYCTVARLGGDEFGMLIPHAGAQEAIGTGARLIDGLAKQTFSAGEHDLRISASAGVVLYPDHGDEPSRLVARADIAMYDAKARGGNQVVAYTRDDTWQTAMTERLEAAEKILSAMREDRLVLYGQPIVRPSSDGPRCFELLIRMRSEDGTLIYPADIIPTAERLGLIRDIDRWVARRAIRLLSLAEGENQDVQFSINLSGYAFSDQGLLDVIRDEFASTGASPERLIIEITETTAIANMEGARRFIDALRKIGCRFSIDDFGSAASSFYYLKHLPVDFLKIDGSLVTGLARNTVDAHFVHAIVEMCRGLEISTVAEYVESESVLSAIDEAGVDFAQGFHLGRPEPLQFYLGVQFSELAQTRKCRSTAVTDAAPASGRSVAE